MILFVYIMYVKVVYEYEIYSCDVYIGRNNRRDRIRIYVGIWAKLGRFERLRVV